MKKVIALLISLDCLFAGFSQVSYTYDNLQRLTQTIYPNGTKVQFQYDATGNRISQTTGLAPGVAIDVTIQNASLVSMVVQQGGTLRLNAAEANIGSTAAVAHYVRFFLSSNNTLDAGDIQLDQEQINSLSANTSFPFANRSITIPVATAIGNYFLLLVADAGNNLAETNEANNVTAIPFTVSTATSITDPQNPTMFIRITPNPASQYVNITGLSSSKIYQYSLSDYTGRSLLNGNISQSNQQQININTIPAGVYLLRLYSVQQKRLLGTEKIIIVH